MFSYTKRDENFVLWYENCSSITCVEFMNTEPLNVNRSQRETWWIHAPRFEFTDSGDRRYEGATTLRLGAIPANPCRIVGVENLRKDSTDHDALQR